MAEENGERIAIEIETGNSSSLENSRKCAAGIQQDCFGGSTWENRNQDETLAEKRKVWQY